MTPALRLHRGLPARRRLAWLACAFAAALLVGCASVPREPAGTQRLPLAASGRMAVRVDPVQFGEPARVSTAAFELLGSADRGELRLTSPLGTTVAVASWEPGTVWLQAEGRTREFADLDELSREVIGETLPLAALFHWLQRQPWPHAPSAPLPEGEAGFEQLGWAVRTDRAADGLIVAERRTPPPVVVVRVKLDPT
ncbi:MAG TPA: lipoprotein insertase outer membrane protein LolB [Burkholderiaceae bacterium]|nr:lipoprotein insertase outer membrane protein LolB [Burkholderiaceae bacterium]